MRTGVCAPTITAQAVAHTTAEYRPTGWSPAHSTGAAAAQAPHRCEFADARRLPPALPATRAAAGPPPPPPAAAAGPRAVRARWRARRRRRRRPGAGGAYGPAGEIAGHGWPEGRRQRGGGKRLSWAGTSKEIISNRAGPDRTERTTRRTPQGGRRAAATNRQGSPKRRRRRVRRAGTQPLARPRHAPRAGPDTCIKCIFMHMNTYDSSRAGACAWQPKPRTAAEGSRSSAWRPKLPVHGGRSRRN